MSPNLNFLIILSLLASPLFVQAAKGDKASTLVVYSARKEQLVKDIFEKYTQETGVEIQLKSGKAAALIETLKAEGSKTKADVLLTVDAGNLWHATQMDLLEPLSSKTLNTNVPAHLREKNGRWFGLSVRARTIAYNTDKVKPEDLSTYEDLASKKWEGRVCLRTSKKVYNQSLVAMLIHELGEKKAKEVVAGWVKNAAYIYSNDTKVLEAVAAGQCDVGIVNTYYLGRLLKNKKLPLKLFWPNQKSFGVHVNVSGAGVVKASHHKEQAQKFLEWLSAQEAQKTFAQVNMEFPVNPNVPQSSETAAWGTFKPNSSFNLTEAGRLQKKAVLLMQSVNYK